MLQGCDNERVPGIYQSLYVGDRSRPRPLEEDSRTLQFGKKIEKQGMAFNEYKVKSITFERAQDDQRVDMRALRSKIAHLEQDNALLKASNEALKNTNEDLMVRVTPSSNKKMKKCVEALVDTIPAKYMGAALYVEKSIGDWDIKEVSKLDPEKEDPEILWYCRAEIVQEGGF